MHNGGTHMYIKVHARIELWNIQMDLGKMLGSRLQKRATQDPPKSSKIDKDANY